MFTGYCVYITSRRYTFDLSPHDDQLICSYSADIRWWTT